MLNDNEVTQQQIVQTSQLNIQNYDTVDFFQYSNQAQRDELTGYFIINPNCSNVDVDTIVNPLDSKYEVILKTNTNDTHQDQNLTIYEDNQWNQITPQFINKTYQDIEQTIPLLNGQVLMKKDDELVFDYIDDPIIVSVDYSKITSDNQTGFLWFQGSSEYYQPLIQQYIQNKDIADSSLNFSKMIFPNVNNVFLRGDNSFLQVTFNNLSGTIDNSQIPNNYIPYSKLVLTDSILNSDINSAANISQSKLQQFSNFNYNGSNLVVVPYNYLNISNSIMNSDINTSANISQSKLQQFTYFNYGGVNYQYITDTNIQDYSISITKNKGNNYIIPYTNNIGQFNQISYYNPTSSDYLLVSNNNILSLNNFQNLRLAYSQFPLVSEGNYYLVAYYGNTTPQNFVANYTFCNSMFSSQSFNISKIQPVSSSNNKIYQNSSTSSSIICDYLQDSSILDNVVSVSRLKTSTGYKFITYNNSGSTQFTQINSSTIFGNYISDQCINPSKMTQSSTVYNFLTTDISKNPQYIDLTGGSYSTLNSYLGLNTYMNSAYLQASVCKLRFDYFAGSSSGTWYSYLAPDSGTIFTNNLKSAAIMFRVDQELSCINYDSGSFGAIFAYYSSNNYQLSNVNCVKTLKAYITFSGTLTTVSSRKHKENIKKIDFDFCDSLLNIDFYDYNYISAKNIKCHGIMAEDMLKCKIKSRFINYEPSNDVHGVDNHQLSMYLLKCCQEQEKKIRNLEDKVNDLIDIVYKFDLVNQNKLTQKK